MKLRHDIRGGLTLIELLLVIGIIVVLVALSLGAYSRGWFKARHLQGYIGEGQKSIVDSIDREEGRK